MSEDVLVCAKLTAPLMLKDNRIGVCDACGCGVQYRPHAPPSRKLCQGCFVEALQNEDGDALLYTTQAMLDDFKAYLKGKLS
jgi:hypothetical protein